MYGWFKRVSYLCLTLMCMAAVAGVTAAAVPEGNAGLSSKRSSRRKHAKGKTRGLAPPAAAAKCTNEDPDLTGDYKGTLNFPERTMQGRATLSITKVPSKSVPYHTFILTMDDDPGNKVEGTLMAPTTCGYTAVTLSVRVPTALWPLSLTACRRGSNFSLKSTNAEVFSFTTDGCALGGTPYKWGRCKGSC
jgi:hypothetical protein